MTLYYPPTQNGLQKELGAQLAQGETGSVTLNNVTGIQNLPGVFVANRINSSGVELDTSVREWISYTAVSGSTLTGLTRGLGGSSDQDHEVGSIIEFVPDITVFQALLDVLLSQHDSSGVHTDITADSITLASGATPTEFSTDTTLAGNSDTAVPTEKAVKTYVDASSILTSSSYAPEGFLINGKLSVSVASSNLTVAIKGLDGNDPSSSNKVYVRIGNTVHTLTAALSVTKNAGTNWMALGDAKIATNEVDLFAYLGYNATDGVVIGFSRICHATKYGDFSTTSTNDRYAAISTITTAASTDEYTVIGRFNAVLNASASYNWSIPATAVVINRPIYETRRLTYTNVYTGWSGSVTGTVYYQIVGSRCHLFTTESVGGTSNATTKTMRLPINIGITGTDFSWVGAFVQDNTSWQQYPGHVRIENGAPDTVKIGKTVHLTAWTASGTATIGLMGFMFPL